MSERPAWLLTSVRVASVVAADQTEELGATIAPGSVVFTPALEPEGVTAGDPATAENPVTALGAAVAVVALAVAEAAIPPEFAAITWKL